MKDLFLGASVHSKDSMCFGGIEWGGGIPRGKKRFQELIGYSRKTFFLQETEAEHLLKGDAI